MIVSVLMPTYNHECFIAQAIESFLMQKCDFGIELLISNDCSTDNTFQIAKQYADKYPDKIKLFDQRVNLGLIGNYKFLLEQSAAPYFAILESDDYWTYPFKLQKQVDILRSNSAVGFVYTSADAIGDDGQLLFHQMASKCGDIYHDLLTSHFMLAVTLCFSRQAFDKYCDIDDYLRLGFKTFDHPTVLSIAANCQVRALDDTTAVYRWLQSSISNSGDYKKITVFFDSIDHIESYVTARYGKAGLSDCKIYNRQVSRRIEVALRNGQIKEVRKYCRKLKVEGVKTLAMKLFPNIWIVKNRV